MIVSLPSQAEMMVAMHGTAIPPRIQMRLIELSSFQCKFTYSYTANKILEEVSNLQNEVAGGED